MAMRLALSSALADRQGDGEHAVVKQRLGLVLLDRKGQRDHPLEAAIIALGKPTLFILGLGPLLAPVRALWGKIVLQNRGRGEAVLVLAPSPTP